MGARTYDVAVIGLGVMGSAVTDALARRGRRVIAFDRFARGETRGASRGQSRLLRRICYEHPAYDDLAARAWEGWRSLEASVGQNLLVETPTVTIGPEESPMVRGILAARGQSDDTAEIGRRLSWLRLAPDEVALVDPRSAVLRPEACVAALQHRASAHGAQLCFESPARVADPDTPRVETSEGAIEVGQVVFAAGAWSGAALPPPFDRTLGTRLRPERIASFWFRPRAPLEGFMPQRCPVVLWDRPGQPLAIFPWVGGHGVKVAGHHSERFVAADDVDRTVHPEEIRAVREQLAERAPVIDHELVHAEICMYTTTPDRNFVVGRLGDGDLWLLSACSGHGFKHAPAVAELLARALIDGHPLPSLFSPSRAALGA